MQERRRFKQLGSLDTRLSSEAERLRKEARGIAVESRAALPRSPIGMMFASSVASCLGAHMGEVVRFIPKSDLDRVRLIREAREVYDRIFPPVDPAREQRNDPKE